MYDELTFEEALAALDSTDEDELIDGVYWLMEHPDRRATSRLVELAQDESALDVARCHAICALAYSRDPAGFDVVLSALEDEELADEAAFCVGRYEDPRAIDALGNYMLGDGEPFARGCAANALGLIGHPDATPYLVRGAHDRHRDVRLRAVMALGHVGVRGADHAEVGHLLIEIASASKKQRDVRDAALTALGGVRSDEAFEFLADSIARPRKRETEAENSRVSSTAWGLRYFDEPRCLDAIERGFDLHGYFVVVPASILIAHHGAESHIGFARRIVECGDHHGFDALSAIGNEAALAAILELLPTVKKSERVFGLSAAAKLGHTESCDELAKMLKSKKVDGDYAAIGLVEAGDRRGKARCVELLDGEYHNIRRHAVTALGRLGDSDVMESLERFSYSQSDEDYVVARDAMRALQDAQGLAPQQEPEVRGPN